MWAPSVLYTTGKTLLLMGIELVSEALGLIVMRYPIDCTLAGDWDGDSDGWATVTCYLDGVSIFCLATPLAICNKSEDRLCLVNFRI